MKGLNITETQIAAAKSAGIDPNVIAIASYFELRESLLNALDRIAELQADLARVREQTTRRIT